MPFPVAAAITAGSQLLSTGLGGWFTKNRNRQEHKYATDMYNRQYSDNLRLWHMQNEYNSPRAQMQRYKEAGLNPVLPFLKGGGMASGNAGNIKAPDAQNVNFETPDMTGIGQAGISAIEAMYSLEMKSAQIDNLKAHNSNIYADTALKAAQATGTDASTKYQNLRTSQFGQLIDTNIQAAKEALRQTTLQNRVFLEKHEMDMAVKSKSLAEATERIAMSKIQQKLGKAKAREYAQTLKTIIQQQKLNQFEIDLNRLGQTKQDQQIWRILGTIINRTLEKAGLSYLTQ